ncbi:MAG TPA: S8 family serine peptidase [Candidatus Rubrimentiphilum sp.]|nr:S8 family serine peptidase [Candidatus Rubrimentiphilum sp.]
MNLKTRLAALAIAGVAVLAACGGGGGSGGGVVPPGGSAGGVPALPTSTPTNSPNASTVCRSSGAPQSIVAAAVAQTEARRMPSIARGSRNEFAPGVIEIVYRRSVLAEQRADAARLVEHVQGDVRSEFDSLSDRIQIVSVAPGTEDAAIRQIASSAIVEKVARSAVRRLQSTTAATLNDPYFNGFTPSNTPPLYESAAKPGQWDMHVICAANAWGYGNANTTGSTFSGALGGSVKLAIVDTGADLTHRDLAGRAVFAESVINGAKTVGIASMHDNDGHGTNVAGIAAASGNNGFGFAGVAYAVPLLIFKVFPDPPCGTGGCTASGADVGMAISDAVAQGARVINLSLGASGPDTAEEAAVAQAIANGVVVVAASGNETATTLDFPAADPGVIAVGASSLDDSNPASIVESVASYSNYDATNRTWGVVAPGGDPSGSGDLDDLHWIENVYSSTASGSSCGVDLAGASGDCRALIAGTSQATPHVSGAAALMLSVNGLLTPAAVKSTLCATARNIGNAKEGCGRLDAYRAVAHAANDPNP